MPLGELTDDEARALIERGANGDQPFTPTEMSEVLTLAGNHPYRLQLAGSLVYQTKANNQAVIWSEIQRAYKQQLQQVGLEVNVPREAKKLGKKFFPTIISAIQSAIQELFKALIDGMNKPR